MKYLSLIFFAIVPFMGSAQSLADWEGDYEGIIYMTPLHGQPNEIKMTLSIHEYKKEVYDWIITYGDSAQDVRSYQLIYMSPGEWQMDEKNGIFLKMSKLKNELISMFNVSGSNLFVSYMLKDGGIDVKITSGSKLEESGGSMDSDGNVIPIVESYTTDIVQVGTLKKSAK